MGNGLHGQMFFQFIHDFIHFAAGNYHHSSQGLHWHVIRGPSASQTRVALLLH